jgi:DNA-binding response OmpR family regulator
MSNAVDLDSSPEATALAAQPQDVLLIEDNDDAMLWVQWALRQYGNSRYHLEWAKDLDGGVDQISKGGIDVVLLDLGLPDGAGASSYSRIHQVAPDIPILVLTGNPREGTEFAVIARGAYDYLVKDQLSGPRLVEAIQAALDLSHQQQTPNHMRKLALDTKSMLSELIQPAAADDGLRIEQGKRGWSPDGF